MGSQPVRLSYGNMISVPSSLNENFCSSGFSLLPVFVPVKQSSFSFTEWITMCRPSRRTFQIPHRFPLPESCFVIWLVSCLVSVLSVVFCHGGYEQTCVWIKCGRSVCRDMDISCHDMNISTKLLQLPLKYSAQYI